MKSCAIGIVRAMPSRSTILPGLLAAPVLLGGCTGQSVEGAWRGPFPLAPGKPCELRLKGDRSVAVECAGTALVGAGRYAWNGTTLEIALTALAVDGEKAKPPAPLRFRVEGHGNTLRVASDGEVVEWTRRPY